MANQVLPWWAFALMGTGMAVFIAMLVVSIRRNHGVKRSLFSTPYTLWMLIFTVLPCILIAYYALVDKNGNAVPDNGTMLHFEVSGNGELFGVDNGNAADSLSLKGHDKAFFNGKALAVIRSIKDTPGSAKLTVTSDFGKSELVVKCK